MAILKEFKKQLKRWIVDHPGFSNIDVHAHCECPHCKTLMLLEWHLYPEMFLRYAGEKSITGFSFMGVEFYRVPGEDIVFTELWESSQKTEQMSAKNKGEVVRW